MDAFRGKTAVITGGAGLLGAAMALRFARVGMNVVIADIHQDRIDETVRAVEALGVSALGVVTDAADAGAMDALAEAAYARFGAVHILCLNAGRAILKPFAELTRDDWNAVLGVQFGGVLNGVLSFLPRLIAQGGERHIVVTSSMSGVGRADLRLLNAPYVTAKFAAVGLSEVMQPALAPHGIDVSVLCPGMTVRDPEALAKSGAYAMPSAAWYKDNLLDAAQVAEEVLHGVREKRLYIFPHRAGRGEVESRHAKVIEGFDQAARTSPE
ncbi:MAG: SDR family NAD(P)-dependent oxidoreductase [Caulobacterales bacterium]